MTEPIYVSRSKIKGEGVFASRDIKRGEVVCKMKGEKIPVGKLHKVSQSGRDIVVDPLQISQTEYVNLARPYVVINHSCDPNCGIRQQHLVAIKKISKNEEITYDYSSTWFDGFNCNCGSRICRGHVGDFLGISKSVQRKYIKLGIIPDFILKTLPNSGS